MRSDTSRSDQAPEANVIGSRIVAAPHAGGNPIAGAVAGMTKKRSSTDDALERRGLVRIKTLRGACRIPRDASGGVGCVGVGSVPIGTPLPDVAGHIVEAISVGLECANRTGLSKVVGCQVLIGATGPARCCSGAGEPRCAGTGLDDAAATAKALMQAPRPLTRYPSTMPHEATASPDEPAVTPFKLV
jgi:hypothetical protein